MEEKDIKNEEISFEDIKEEVQDGPDEEEFTKAIESLSDTDRDIFEDTGVIHIDRDMPAETQAMHVVELQKEHNKKRNHVFGAILGLMIAGALIAIIGLVLNRISNTSKATISSEVEEGVSSSEELLAIDETSFPDAIFRSYVQKNIDTDGDGSLSASERNAVIMLLAPEDSALTNLQGIEYFPLLQSLTCKNTGIIELDASSNEELTFIDCSNTPITSLLLPTESRIETINAENTALTCSQNEDGYYNACVVNDR